MHPKEVYNKIQEGIKEQELFLWGKLLTIGNGRAMDRGSLKRGSSGKEKMKRSL